MVLLSFVFTFASLPFYSVINAVCLYCRWRFSVLYDVVLRSPGEEVMANNTANWYFPHWMLTAGLVVFFARSKSGYFTKMFSGTVEQCSTLCIFCTVVYTLYFLLLSNKTMGGKTHGLLCLSDLFWLVSCYLFVDYATRTVNSLAEHSTSIEAASWIFLFVHRRCIWSSDLWLGMLTSVR